MVSELPPAQADVWRVPGAWKSFLGQVATRSPTNKVGNATKSNIEGSQIIMADFLPSNERAHTGTP